MIYPEDISVELTDTNVEECIRIRIKGQVFLLHTTVAMNLRDKLEVSITKWINESAKWITEMITDYDLRRINPRRR